MDVDQPPAVTPAIGGIYNTKPTAVVEGTASVLVKASYSGGTASLNDKPVVFSGTGWPSVEFTANSSDYSVGCGLSS